MNDYHFRHLDISISQQETMASLALRITGSDQKGDLSCEQLLEPEAVRTPHSASHLILTALSDPCYQPILKTEEQTDRFRGILSISRPRMELQTQVSGHKAQTCSHSTSELPLLGNEMFCVSKPFRCRIPIPLKTNPSKYLICLNGIFLKYIVFFHGLHKRKFPGNVQRNGFWADKNSSPQVLRDAK